MDKVLSCRDMGKECDFVACAGTESDVLKKAGDHARSVHGIKRISNKDKQKARLAIHEGSCGDWLAEGAEAPI